MPTKPARQRLNIFLIKDHTAESEILKDAGKLVKHTSPANLDFPILLYTKASSLKPPSWLKFVKQATTDPLRELLGQSANAMLILNVSSRWFCICFGHSRSWIEDSKIERRFGMLVTLNCVDIQKLKSVDREEFDTVTRNTRSQTSTSASIENFGLNIQRDLVRSVTGEPKDENFGSHVTGADNLILSASLDLAELPSKCELSLKYYKEKTYKENFPWIDNFQRVTDKTILDTLDAGVVADIRAGVTEGIFLSPPSLMDTQDARVYRYPGQRMNSDAEHDLRLEQFLARRPGSSVTVDLLKKAKFREFQSDTDTETRTFSVYDALVVERKKDGLLYALTQGEWFGIDGNYVSQVEAELATIATNANISLPIAMANELEGHYNTRAAAESDGDLICLDQKNVMYGGGNSKVEICDLMSINGALIHVKAKTKSATLSHLFSQGLVSAQVLREPAFRTLAKAKCPDTHGVMFEVDPFQPKNHSVCYAVITTSKQKVGDALPFFSKQSLVNAAKELRNMGYGVALNKIEQLP
jgi:uncharacterized protein (TIGR04141 family)